MSFITQANVEDFLGTDLSQETKASIVAAVTNEVLSITGLEELPDMNASDSESVKTRNQIYLAYIRLLQLYGQELNTDPLGAPVDLGPQMDRVRRDLSRAFHLPKIVHAIKPWP